MPDEPDLKEQSTLRRPRVPPVRTAYITFLLAAVPTLTFAALAAFGLLERDVALVAVFVCLLSSAALARLGLRDIYTARQEFERLTRDGGEDVDAARHATNLFPELSETATRLGQAWEHERRQLTDRADLAEAVFMGLPDALILINKDRQIVRATAGATALLGDISLERDLSSLLRNPEVLEAAERVIANDEAGFVEFEGRFPVDMTLNVRLQRLPSYPGDDVLVILSVTDVTQLKRVQQVRTDFVANVSHELKTPLSVLSGCIETLQGAARDDPDARRKFTDLMATHITRMIVLIEDLLSLSRIELNESMPPTGTVSLHELLADVVQALEIPAQLRNTDIRIERHTERDEVSGDRSEIFQLFRNLIENAVMYGREESEVVIATRLLKPAGGASIPVEPVGIEIEIVDRGAGIAAHHIPRLTERFYRIDAARSRQLGGTGLGLAIVKHIVSRHRGRLLIESVEGEGSSFVVQLPVSENAALAALTPVPGRAIVI